MTPRGLRLGRYRALATAEAVDRVISQATPAELARLFAAAGPGGLRRLIGRVAVNAGRFIDVEIVEEKVPALNDINQEVVL